MMLQLGDDGVVTSVNEEDLVYVDKSELEKHMDSYRQLEEENEQLKQVIGEFVENPTQHNLWKLRTVLKGDDEND